ncbi:anthranilate/aminodeoxychorismate synthase component II [Halobaculum sp. WSA2]|uniref:anthranilate synthase n=1 Tax=Halobaculum saliterrae TaxID=2073113 RepID=A0A6B0SLT5_9EURY|nr:anthranilate synthase component II [Halobaculum saliterrae]MXR39854.1 anthranilate/aminodeoxychorismate synthase component II [Halobaculum saliterrae]
MNVTVVDNYDSFTYNLVEYVSDLRIGGESPDISVLKNAATLEAVRDTDPDALLISPGPGHPRNDRDVGVTMPVLRELSPEVPTLGVCLGLEAAVYEYGGAVGHAPEPIHGKAFPVDHDGEGVFAGLEQGFRAGRYHSLIATEVPDCFAVTATTDHAVSGSHAEGRRTESGESEELVMGVRHREHPIEAVQFHPESVLTAVGHDVIENFLRGV